MKKVRGDVVDTLAVLMHAPRTIKEIQGATGFPHTTVARHLQRLKLAGLVYVRSFSGPNKRVVTYDAQTTPFEHPSATKGIT